jgi:LmbE family N-acetylglucosaminyl deacetylase/SAM-dependent methyltransferase
LVSTVADPRPFRHDRPGVPAEQWWSHPARGGVDEMAPADARGGPLRRLVVLAAHPDDEVLGAGGLLAWAGAQPELEVEVVVITDGEASHPGSPTHPPAALGRLRRDECRRGLDRLGDGLALHHLAVPDGRVAAAEQSCVDRLTALVGDGRGVLLLAPWRHDGHPDHEAAGRVAAAAAVRTGARLLEYPVWFWHWAQPEEAPWPSMLRWPVAADALDAKRRAMTEHRSQVAGLSSEPGDEPLLGERFLDHFLAAQELYVEQPAVDPALDLLHADASEPWGADRRWYEERKRALLLAMLPGRHVDRILELGCSTGVTTVALAGRCRELVAVDASPAALATARSRVGDLPGVAVEQRRFPDDWPPGRFDVVVLSEVGYFLDPGALERTVAAVQDSLAPGGVVLLCHWRHPVAGWVLDGADVHAVLEREPWWERLAQYVDDDVELLLLGPAGSLPEPTA